MERVTAPKINNKTLDEIAQEILTQFIAFVETRHGSGAISEYGTGTISAQLAAMLALDVKGNYTIADIAIPKLKPAFFALLGTLRHDATKATCTLTFSIESPTITEITIPIGTKVRTNIADRTLWNVYQTTEIGVIPVGQTSVTVDAESVESGSAYRVKAGTLTVMMSPVPYIHNVTNSISIGGYDQETNEEAAERLQGIMQTYYVAASPSSFESLAKQVTGVYRAKCYRNTDYACPTAIVAGHSTLIIQGEENETDELIDQVTQFLDDKRIGNCYTHIKKVPYLTINIIGSLRIHTYDLTTVVNNVEQKLTEEFRDWEWQRNLTMLDIKSIVLSADGVVNCTITTPDDTIIMGKYSLPKLGVTTFSQWL